MRNPKFKDWFEAYSANYQGTGLMGAETVAEQAWQAAESVGRSYRNRTVPLDEMVGELTAENVRAQFCSDWLKDEMLRVFRERDEALIVAGVARERLGPAGWRLLDELTNLRQLRDKMRLFYEMDFRHLGDFNATSKELYGYLQASLKEYPSHG